MWIFKYPASRLIFIYQLYLIFGFFYIFHKDFIKTSFGIERNRAKNSIFKRYKKLFLSTFITFNIVLTYAIIISVTVITNHKIIDHSFFTPQGKEYSYTDVVKIDTGVYGKKLYFPFTHAKGEFFYVIELNDGTRIDLNEIGGAKKDVDHRSIIEELDIELVNMGIPKESSMKNFEYATEHLDEIYTDKIRNILENTK
jgi:hypothetical protein